jgi:hypothetical protein
VRDHVVTATQYNDGTTRPKNRNQKHWHIDLLVVVGAEKTTHTARVKFPATEAIGFDEYRFLNQLQLPRLTTALLRYSEHMQEAGLEVAERAFRLG